MSKRAGVVICLITFATKTEDDAVFLERPGAPFWEGWLGTSQITQNLNKIAMCCKAAAKAWSRVRGRASKKSHFLRNTRCLRLSHDFALIDIPDELKCSLVLSYYHTVLDTWLLRCIDKSLSMEAVVPTMLDALDLHVRKSKNIFISFYYVCFLCGY